ncbi:MAG: DUF2029 domain-containing protein [Chloroflexi bacterium]|nr:MAG: DUF2029 domain-containing protein [Chloroflexota bacterium]
MDVIDRLRAERLLTRSGLLWGAWSAALSAAALAVAVAVVKARGRPNLDGLFNDFYDYWAAGRILQRGGNPYDAGLMSHVLASAGVHSTVGGAYSYPLLLSPLGRVTPVQGFVVATAAALFAPVVGTLYFGQVNLYLLPLLALALRGARPEAGIAGAAAVKLYPSATALAFVTRGRRGVRPLLVTVAAVLGLSLLPNVLAGVWPARGGALAMVGPDRFWSNESINGWLSRLPLSGLAVTLLMVASGAALGALVLALVLARRDRPWAGAFALLLCYGVVAAPKNSLWNFAPLVVAGTQWWSASDRRLRAAALGTLAWALVGLQGVVDAAQGFGDGRSVLAGALGSVALLGGLLLLGMLARQLLAAPPPAARRDERERAAA